MTSDSKLSAIIIEDTPTKAEVLKALAENAGILDITLCETGQAGIDALSHADADSLVFLDLLLPDISGQEILREMARLHFQGRVIVTSLCERRIVETALLAASDTGIKLLGVLVPPYSLEDLSVLLEKLHPSSYVAAHAQHRVLLTEEEIFQAFEEDRIEPFFQPILHLNEQRLDAVECLARIKERGSDTYLSPVSFMSQISDIAFLDNLCLRLFKKSIEHIEESAFANTDLKLALNLDPVQLSNSSLCKTLHELTTRSSIVRERVVFELTENGPLEGHGQFEIINILRLQGYNIAIDDFGTGYTNLANLTRLPFNRVKVDRQLLHGIDSNTFNQVALDGILATAKEVDANVVVEGIETKEQVIYLSQYRDIFVQGHYFCPALSFPNFVDWFNKSAYKIDIH